jgi:VIT family
VPQTPHIEHHFASSEAVRDIVIGMSDGLTVPFALAAGLSGSLESSSLIVVAGLAGYRLHRPARATHRRAAAHHVNHPLFLADER